MRCKDAERRWGRNESERCFSLSEVPLILMRNHSSSSQSEASAWRERNANGLMDLRKQMWRKDKCMRCVYVCGMHAGKTGHRFPSLALKTLSHDCDRKANTTIRPPSHLLWLMLKDNNSRNATIWLYNCTLCVFVCKNPPFPSLLVRNWVHNVFQQQQHPHGNWQMKSTHSCDTGEKEWRC